MKIFGHQRPVRDTAGNIVETKTSPARAVTVGALDGSFGSDRAKKLIVSLEAGDLVVIRPQGTRRAMKGTAFDIYRFLVRSEANKRVLEKARVTKSQRQARKVAASIRRADRAITAAARRENGKQ